MAFDKAYLRGIGEKIAGVIEGYSREHYGYTGDISKYTAFVKTMVKNDPTPSKVGNGEASSYVFLDMTSVREALCDLCDKYDEGLYIFIKSFLELYIVILYDMDVDEYLDYRSESDIPYQSIQDVAALYWLSLLDKKEGLSFESADTYRNIVLTDSSYEGTELRKTLSGELYNVADFWNKAFYAQNNTGLASFHDDDDTDMDENFDNLVFNSGIGLVVEVINRGVETYSKL